MDLDLQDMGILRIDLPGVGGALATCTRLVSLSLAD